MKLIYLDLYIYIFDNFNKINNSYDFDFLLKKLSDFNGGLDYLIFLIDYNIINKSVYLNVLKLVVNIILGVELYIRNYDNCFVYYCYIYFDLLMIDEGVIDDLNLKLDELYLNKVVEKLDKLIFRI